MNIIKLGAINSTNDYLKQLIATQYVDNFTVVAAEHQTKGRGQMGSVWETEPSKNLTFSVLIKDLLIDIKEIFALNAAVAVSIMEALTEIKVPDVCIKWPNDILAGSKKIGGILIENSIKNNGEIFSVVGIGLNVNQKGFESLPKASSLAVVAGHEFDRDVLMQIIVNNLRQNVSALLNNGSAGIWEKYHKKLYKRGIPMPFEKNNQKFMGIIQSVTRNGNLEVLLEDDTVVSYGIKEVQLLY
jgi:BirA family biotin operon repressor/biotin-[acetyl-CoA-carboxylase] ligase